MGVIITAHPTTAPETLSTPPPPPGRGVRTAAALTVFAAALFTPWLPTTSQPAVPSARLGCSTASPGRVGAESSQRSFEPRQHQSPNRVRALLREQPSPVYDVRARGAPDRLPAVLRKQPEPLLLGWRRRREKNRAGRRTQIARDGELGLWKSRSDRKAIRPSVDPIQWEEKIDARSPT
jgi:hypothetical protein